MAEENRQELINGLERTTGSLDGYFSFLENCGNYTYGEGIAEIEESSVKKKRSKKRMRKEDLIEEEGEEGALAVKSQDPLVVHGLDIMYLILSSLDATDVAPCLLVSRGWHGVASSDRLWSSMVRIETHSLRIYQKHLPWLVVPFEFQLCLDICMLSTLQCDKLWRGKAHIPRIARLPGLPKLAVYSLSAMDGKRTRITRDDLCDHVWEFRFNKDAPEYWRKLDPSWEEGNENGRPMIRYFHRDGSQTAGPGDKVWGGHEASYCTVTGINAEGKIRAHYVRINRWEPLTISRKNDWTWEMSNKLVRYTSIPDSDKEDVTGPLFVDF